jgi:F-type H+-transporting ATPase subunit a
MGDFLLSAPTFLAATEGGHGPTIEGLFVYIGILVVVLFVLLAQAKKGLGQRVFKNRWTQMTEQLYLFIENMCVGTIGSHGRKYIPIIMVFWMVVFLGNTIALFFPTSPTADLSFNLGMALISIGYVQWEGIKSNGFFGHLSHFAGPKLGIALLPITGMIFIIEIISEVMKNVSLSLRLFGNIEGGHQAVEAMNAIGAQWYIPVGAFLLPIKILTVVVQAMIFTLLTCVYLSLVTAHHDDDHAHGHEEAHEPAHPAQPNTIGAGAH